MEIKGIGNRLHEAREAKGLSKLYIGKRIGINDQWVFDLEAYDHEIPSTLHFVQVCELATLVSLTPRELVLGKDIPEDLGITTATQVSEAIKLHLMKHNLSTDEFGKKVGWNVSSAIEDPEHIWAVWCLECIRDVCEGVGIDWRTVLPPSHEKP